MTLVGWTGRMGSTWADSVVNQGHVLGDWIGDTPGQTTPNDTNDLVVQLMAAGVDGILYAGGDGTTRDIVHALETCGEEAQKQRSSACRAA